MELRKEKFEGMRLVARPECKQSYEWDIIVPDSKPDILKVINTEGSVSVISKEIMQDRAVINCNIRINIIYMSADEDAGIKNVECVQNVNYVMENKDLKQKMPFCIYVSIDKIFSNIINSRKLNINCNICYIGEAYDRYTSEYVSDIEDDRLKYKCRNLEGFKLLDCVDDTFSVSDDIEIPSGKSSAESVISVRPEFTNMDIKNANGKFVLRGNVCIAVVYDSVAEGDGIQYMINETPVNEIVECEYINEENILDCDVKISNFNYMLKENSDGEKRIIKYTCDVNINGKLFGKMCINPVVDVYSTTDEIKLCNEKCRVDKYDKVEAGQFWVKDIVRIDNKKDIQRIICTDCKAHIDKVAKEMNGIKLIGHVCLDILYQSIDGEVCNVRCEMPYEYFVDNGTMYEYPTYDIKTQVESCSYNIISADSIEMRVGVGYKIKIKNTIEIDFVNDIEITGKNNACKNGISIVFCEGNEILWDIAKKYKTTVEEIIMVNELESEKDIEKGKKLLIP